MAKNKVFIGYDYDSDKASKDRLLGWDVNKEFDFSAYDRSFDVAVDSEEAAVFKQDLAALIGDSSHFLCIVGKETYRSAWMAWEIPRRSNSTSSSWPLRPIRLTTRRPQCRGLGRRGARRSTPMEFVETISVIEQTLRKDPGRMIFPLTGLLGETEACVCFSCSGTALACQYCSWSITWF